MSVSNKKAIGELEDGAEYEKYIETAFKKVSKKETIPATQIDIIDTSSDRLQNNITKSNLKEIITGGPALIGQIADEIRSVDGDFIEFNKYFPTFKKALPYKIKNIEQFRSDWTLFKEQQLGRNLSPNTIYETPINEEDITDLENMSNEDLDKKFREVLVVREKKTVDNIQFIRYNTSKGALSKPLELINKDGIISFKPIPMDSSITGKGNEIIRINNAKIRYIYGVTNPYANTTTLKVRWNGSGSGSKGKEVVAAAVGSGLDQLLSLKKKSVHFRYR